MHLNTQWVRLLPCFHIIMISNLCHCTIFRYFRGKKKQVEKCAICTLATSTATQNPPMRHAIAPTTVPNFNYGLAD